MYMPLLLKISTPRVFINAALVQLVIAQMRVVYICTSTFNVNHMITSKILNEDWAKEIWIRPSQGKKKPVGNEKAD